MINSVNTLFLKSSIFFQGPNFLTMCLQEKLTERGHLYLISGISQKKNFLRFVISSSKSEKKDVIFAWEEIRSQTELMLKNSEVTLKDKKIIPRSDNDVTVRNMNGHTKEIDIFQNCKNL